MSRLFIASLMGILLPGLAAAAMPQPLQSKVEALAQRADSISKQRHKWEGVQQALMAQKPQIEAAQKELDQQQDDLNSKSAVHNQAAAAQQQRLKDSGCGGKDNGSGGDLGTANCNKDAKKLNANSADLNTETTGLQSEQTVLEAKFTRANQDASDWNAHESVATQHLNGVYHDMNDWLDSAYEVITDGDFRDEVTARGTDADCENKGLPAGTLPIATVKRLTDSYRKCFRSVLDAQHKSATAAPTSSTHP
jgi:hypothetical protein